MPRSLLVLALLPAIALPIATAGLSAAPSLVIAAGLDDARTLVAWAPGAVPADSYRVYGVSSVGALTLLAETPSAAAEGPAQLVPGGFATYAVSGVVDGVESEPTLAVGGGCVWYDDSPPAVHVTTECLEAVGRVRAVIRA